MTFAFKDIPAQSKTWKDLKKKLESHAKKEKKKLSYEFYQVPVDSESLRHSTYFKKHNMMVNYDRFTEPNSFDKKQYPLHYKCTCVDLPAAKIMVSEGIQGFMVMVKGTLA